MFRFLILGCLLLTACQQSTATVTVTPEGQALETACPITPSVLTEQARLQGALKIVAIGSSTIEGVGASSPQRNFVSGLTTALSAALPGSFVQVINAGVGGQNLPQMMARFQKDIYAVAPNLVILQTGMNDAIQNRDGAMYRIDLQRALNDLQQHNLKVALMSNQYAGQVGPTATPLTLEFDKINKSESTSRGIPIIDRFSLFKSLEDQGVNIATTYFVPDLLHANDEGYRLITRCAVRRVFGLN